MFRSLELFAGIGGLSLGLEWAGLCHPAAFCEIDPYARAVLRKHWPEVAQYDDVRTLGADALDRDGIGRPDLIAGGWPCQPHSFAGKRESSNDDRDLWSEYARIIGETRPRWVVGENVPGVLSSADPAHGRGKGGFFGRVLADLAGLGYDAEWHSFTAASVGAPHLRSRVFLVAHAPELFSDGRDDHPGGDSESPRPFPESGNGRGAAPVADAGCSGRAEGQPDLRGRERYAVGQGDADVADARRLGLEGQRLAGEGERAGRGAQPGREAARAGCSGSTGGSWWGAEPDVGQVAHGVPARVDRLRTLGNAVVPYAAQVIGEAIRDAEECRRLTGALPAQIVRPEHIQRVRGAA